MKKNFIVYLPVELQKQFKIWCIENNTTISQAVEKLIREAIECTK